MPGDGLLLTISLSGGSFITPLNEVHTTDFPVIDAVQPGAKKSSMCAVLAKTFKDEVAPIIGMDRQQNYFKHKFQTTKNNRP